MERLSLALVLIARDILAESLDMDAKIRSAAVAGICFALLSVVNALVLPLFQFFSTEIGRLVFYDAVLSLSAILYVWHVHGYVSLARRTGSGLLGLMSNTYLYIYAIYAFGSIVLFTLYPHLTSGSAAIQGVLVLIYDMCALLFAFALVQARGYRDALAYGAALIAAVPILMFGGGGLGFSLLFILLPIPSIVFLWRESR